MLFLVEITLSCLLHSLCLIMLNIDIFNQSVDELIDVHLCVVPARGDGLSPLATWQALGDATGCRCGLGHIAKHDMLRVADLRRQWLRWGLARWSFLDSHSLLVVQAMGPLAIEISPSLILCVRRRTACFAKYLVVI